MLAVLSGQVAKMHFDQLPRTIKLKGLPSAWAGKTLYNIFNPEVGSIRHNNNRLAENS